MVKWTPGHSGIEGNERSDECAAKGSLEAMGKECPKSFAFVGRQEREKIGETWVDEWKKKKVARGVENKGFSVADNFEPTLHPQQHFTKITNRRVYGLVTQCRTGHSFIGEYYTRFVPTESIDCPCGAQYQTRKHILFHCPRYDDWRDLLFKITPTEREGMILGTREGVKALAKFIARTGAFTKTGDTVFLDEDTEVYDEGKKKKPVEGNGEEGSEDVGGEEG